MMNTDDYNDQSVTEKKLKDGNITTRKLADCSVTTAKIADGNVTTQKIADQNVTTGKLQDSCVTTEKIADLNVTTEKLDDKSVTTEKMADGSVSNDKLEDGSITNDKLAENSITKDKLKDNTIGVEKLDPELRQTINAATGLPENLVETIQNVDDTLKDHQSQLDDKQSQIDDKQQQITANDEDISLLQTRSTQMEETIKSIAATGGASQATAVTYDNANSQLSAINIQSAVDELQGSKIDKTSILQESGEAEDKVMSQKAVSDKLSDLTDMLSKSMVATTDENKAIFAFDGFIPNTILYARLVGTYTKAVIYNNSTNTGYSLTSEYQKLDLSSYQDNCKVYLQSNTSNKVTLEYFTKSELSNYVDELEAKNREYCHWEDNDYLARKDIDADGNVYSDISKEGVRHEYLPTVFMNYLFVGARKVLTESTDKDVIDKNFAEGVSYIENLEYPIIDMDIDGRVHHSVDSSGKHYFPAGIDSPDLNILRSKIIIVDINGNGDYTNLHDAIMNAKDSQVSHVTIFLRCGTYSMPNHEGYNYTGQSLRNISIIGEKRDSCIIKNDNALYGEIKDDTYSRIDCSPLRLSGNVLLKNLTIYSTMNNVSEETKEKYKGYLQSYCVHIDTSARENDVFEIDNCVMYNDHFACVGCGLRSGFTVKIKNCEFKSKWIQTDSGTWVGAVIVHDGENAGKPQQLIIDNSILECSGKKALSVNPYWNNKIDVRLTRNMFFSSTSTPVYLEEGTTELSNRSGMNNVNL